MSLENFQLDTILDIQADFDLALSEKKWSECEAMIEQMGDLGYENEARILHQTYNRAKAKEPNWFKKETGHLSDEEFIKEYRKEVDPRDEADRNYP